jgi:hypothetical protein
MPRYVAFLPLPFLAVAGCGGEAAPKLVPVTGKVVHKGQPLTAGNIFFHPAEGGTEPRDTPSSQLQLDGTFKLVSVPWGDGAKPGKYRVVLSAALAGGIKKPEYADPKKTPWTVEVTDAGLKDHVFEVK